MREYFDIKSNKWNITVKWSFRIRVVIGLIIGGIILYKKL